MVSVVLVSSYHSHLCSNVGSRDSSWDLIEMEMSLTMFESDGVEVNLHPLHMRPWHHRLELVCWISFGQQTVILYGGTQQRVAHQYA